MQTAADPPASDPIAALALRAADRAPPSLTDAQAAFRELHHLHARQLASWLSARVARSDLADVHQKIRGRV
jgi:hypothetical protein